MSIFHQTTPSRRVFVDPSYKAFNDGGLFDLNNLSLNRDSQLEPFHRLKSYLASRDIAVDTADRLLNQPVLGATKTTDYYSFGITSNYNQILKDGIARLCSFVIMEPPVVAPNLYQQLPALTASFEKVYLPNIDGDGYSLEGVNQKRLNQLYWPIPFNNVLESYWAQTSRLNKVVIVNGLHKPKTRYREQYSLRIEALAELSSFDAVDLFGKGWNRWWSRSAFWPPYWQNLAAIMSSYRGPCTSKFEVLSHYDFSLCFENTSIEGYVTEKIFDCLYAGTIPLYLGAPNITSLIPSDVFIDCRDFNNWSEMWDYIRKLSVASKAKIRDAGRAFLQSSKSTIYFDSLIHIFGDCES